MSDIAITVQTIQSVKSHSDADRLEVVKILGTQCVVSKGEYKSGDRVFYFPPDMMISEKAADYLGVKKYLKHVIWNGKKVQSRIAACRIRGISSYGFISPCQERYRDGFDVTPLFDGEKYEPPVVIPGVKDGRELHLEEGNFPRYTDIQNYYRYPDVFEDEEQVVVSEKIHGSCSRIGLIFEDGEWIYAAGSRKVRWMEDLRSARYWNPVNTQMMSLLSDLCNEKNEVIVYGEIFGSSVQDMDYGIEGDQGYCVFDIRVNGAFLDWLDVANTCQIYGVPIVPVIYEGPWICLQVAIEEYVSGKTLVGYGSSKKFKGREGIVIKPARERRTHKIDGGSHRAILKYISVDYLNRKGAQDNA